MESAKVLLVDDEKEFTDTLAERMRFRGLLVDVAGSGAEALEMVGPGVYDAVILDVAMPGMDGIETLKRLLALNPDLQVILLTGQATIRTGVEAMKSGAVEFLEKPARLEDLLVRVERARASAAESRERRMAERVNEILRSKGW
jgi:DNA-binding NtrC family response regulator